jgi:hypothetical protein
MKPTEPASLAVAFGAFLGWSLISAAALAVASYVLHLSWNGSVSELFGVPQVTWRQSIMLLLTAWILATPLRSSRASR